MHGGLSWAVETCDLPALIAQTCGESAARGLGRGGGTICDPRPEHAELHPSFSVWKNSAGVWLWKRRGGEEGGGNAYHLLLSLGHSAGEARRTLLEWTGTPGGWDEGRAEAAPTDVLLLAQEALSRMHPVGERELLNVTRKLRTVTEGSPQAAELSRRGLWPPGPLQVYALGGTLAFVLRGPCGRVYNLKQRSLTGRGRYWKACAGGGAPAWCSPGYGHTGRVLLVEGELNAAAASKSLGEGWDVQGLGGADTWPFLDGLGREVWIYGDGDAPGEALRARLFDLAHAYGSPRVRVIPPLDGQDFCDVLGTAGPKALQGMIGARASSSPVPARFPAQIEAGARERMIRVLGAESDVDWPLRR
ncbi:hypothetical protein DESA109040_14810 [Deinococcus saxicola]|uniref:hypothetical protein n=1 Tax=Deinococcus saxicola TaxID=249406 RepID=UPI0039EFF2A1